MSPTTSRPLPCPGRIVEPGSPTALESPADPEDSVLIAAVRAGDVRAAAALYVQHHDAALAAARAVGPPVIAEALAAEAFATVVATLLAGRGPDRALRPYLVATIRHLFLDKLLSSAHECLAHTHEDVTRGPVDPVEVAVARGVVLDFLTGLPDKWREALWLTVVLGLPADVAGPRMGMRADLAAALSGRAREGLRRAYLLGFPSCGDDKRTPAAPAVPAGTTTTATARAATTATAAAATTGAKCR